MSDSDDDFVESKTKAPRRVKDFSLAIPTGHILVHRKFSSSNLASLLSKVFTVRYDSSLDIVDILVASNVLVFYLTETDIISGLENMSKKLTQLSALSSRNPKLKVTWLFAMSELTEQYFKEFQQKIVLEMSNTIIQISSEDQLVQIVQQLQIASHRANPFIFPKKISNKRSSRLHKDILHAVLNLPLPGLGEKKSRQLLGKFDTIQKISAASRDELTGVLGASLARAVEDCFRRKIVMKKTF